MLYILPNPKKRKVYFCHPLISRLACNKLSSLSIFLKKLHYSKNKRSHEMLDTTPKIKSLFLSSKRSHEIYMTQMSSDSVMNEPPPQLPRVHLDNLSC
jgi:hypothetical protein